jgi:hypothetical protein
MPGRARAATLASNRRGVPPGALFAEPSALPLRPARPPRGADRALRALGAGERCLPAACENMWMPRMSLSTIRLLPNRRCRTIPLFPAQSARLKHALEQHDTRPTAPPSQRPIVTGDRYASDAPPRPPAYGFASSAGTDAAASDGGLLASPNGQPSRQRNVAMSFLTSLRERASGRGPASASRTARRSALRTSRRTPLPDAEWPTAPMLAIRLPVALRFLGTA